MGAEKPVFDVVVRRRRDSHPVTALQITIFGAGNWKFVLVKHHLKCGDTENRLDECRELVVTHSAQIWGGGMWTMTGLTPSAKCWRAWWVFAPYNAGTRMSGSIGWRGARADPLGANRVVLVRWGTPRGENGQGTGEGQQWDVPAAWGGVGCRGRGRARNSVDWERTRRNLRKGGNGGLKVRPKRVTLEVQAASPMQSAFQVPKVPRTQSRARPNEGDSG
ncbi:hypothetical protein B0H17DRAFT_1283326 [Mycena rosella]|uniref:Uncharacterized protein n=1 Tax=Mycena rosella TaxID=1033263 RepID=A0AAD7GFM3_MYCRO|nr:hypothetical protein B0H17DRAFT_1283326 [Mycena rosella]